MTDTTEIAEQVFDPTKVDTKSPNIRLEWGTWVTGAEEDRVVNHFGFYLTWVRNYNVSTDDPSNIRPEWADNQVKDRIWREIQPDLVRAMTYTNLRSHAQLNLHVDLPCPPYNYEVDGVKLVISSGPYRLSGTKPEWQSVMEEMESEVEDMPEGIDISDMYVRASGTATISWSVNVPVTAVLDGDEELDGDMWLGDEDTMQERASEAFEENAGDHIETDDLDLTYSGIEEVYVSESYVD